MAAKTYKAEDLVALLRSKYDDKQRYALFEQVANGTGWAARSWIDAILVYLWPSDGLMRCAFEIKVSRQDFLAELKNPQKNEWARQVCNEFWFVAPKGVIKEQELPEGVGWMRPHGNTLAIVRHAQRTEAEMGPEFVAAIARSMQKQKQWDDKQQRHRILSEDSDYQDAKRMVRELEKFVSEHGERDYELHREGGIEKVLSRITNGAKAEAQVRQIRRALSQFQGNIADLFDDFLVLAHLSMVECDELGKFIVAQYGEQDTASTIAEKRALLKKPKKDRSYYAESGAKKLVGAFDLMCRLKETRNAGT